MPSAYYTAKQSFPASFSFSGAYYGRGEKMKEEEKKPVPWEAVDPKPPVVQSGHMENRRRNGTE